MRAWAAAGALAAASAACAPSAPGAPPIEHRNVVQAAISRLEARIAADTAAAGLSAALDPEELRDEVRGLLVLAAGSTTDLREAAMEDARRLGAAAVPHLHATLGSSAAAAADASAQRVAAAALLSAIDAPEAGEALLQIVEKSQDAWLRAQCAWRLGDFGRRDDWIVPRLVLRLKYETDHETVLWIGDSLARLGNWQGIYALRTVAESAGHPELSAQAQARAAAHAADRGLASALELERLWDSGDAGLALPRRAHSPRYELECWHLVAALAEFNLRPVDDARFVLARLDWSAAGVLAAALADENSYVRHGAAQSLARLGPRGAAAGPELVRALGDPSIATEAASALGRIGWPPGEPELCALLSAEQPFELRLACARAVGGLGLASSAPALRALLSADQALELRQAAAESLVTCGFAHEVAPFLIELLASQAVEPSSTEAALRWELARRAEEPSPAGAAARAALSEWDALAPPANVLLAREDITERRSRRAELARRVLFGG